MLKSSDYEYHINNSNDICNTTQIKINHLLDDYNCVASKENNKKYTLFYENIHGPSTILQNSVFGRMIIDDFGDCGALAILLSVLSGGTEIQEKIGTKTNQFIYNFDESVRIGQSMHEVSKIRYF